MRVLVFLIALIYNPLVFAGNSGGFGFPKPTASMVKFYGDKDTESSDTEFIRFVGNSGGFGFVKAELSSDSNFSNINEIYKKLESLESMNEEELIYFMRELLTLEEDTGIDILDLNLKEVLRIEEKIKWFDEAKKQEASMLG